MHEHRTAHADRPCQHRPLHVTPKRSPGTGGQEAAAHAYDPPRPDGSAHTHTTTTLLASSYTTTTTISTNTGRTTTPTSTPLPIPACSISGNPRASRRAAGAAEEGHEGPRCGGGRRRARHGCGYLERGAERRLAPAQRSDRQADRDREEAHGAAEGEP